MNRRAIWKEFRALLPLWASCAVVVTVRGIAGSNGFNGQAEALVVLGYVVGSLALGAQSFGHEYSDRTLQGLLVQPVSRRRMLLTKLGVVAVLLLLLNAVMWSFPSNIENREWPWYVPGLVLLSSLSIAPLLTMVCASSIAGIVLTAALPGTMWAAMALSMLLKDGAGTHVAQRSAAVIPWVMLGACALAVPETWRRFMRLEASERRADLRLPHWATRRGRSTPAERSGSSPRRNPVWMLAKKELFLQQMSLVIAALYVLCWAAAGLMERFAPDFPVDFPLLPITIMYSGLLSIVIGSLASAEERQFGTLQSQVLLPMSMPRQWFVKMTVVVGLALALGIGLPMALSYVHLSEDIRVQGAPPWHQWMFLLQMATTIVIMTSCAVYLSSLSTGGVRALVLAVPATFVASVTLPYLANWAARITYGFVWDSSGRRLGGPLYNRSSFYASPAIIFVARYLWVVLAYGFIALLLRLALQNHRSADRLTRRLVTHAAVVVGYIAISVLLLGGLQGYFRTRFY